VVHPVRPLELAAQPGDLLQRAVRVVEDLQRQPPCPIAASTT
jgi:hypothetical protein